MLLPVLLLVGFADWVPARWHSDDPKTLDLLKGAGGNRDRRFPGGEGQRNRPTDASAASGYQRRPSSERVITGFTVHWSVFTQLNGVQTR